MGLFTTLPARLRALSGGLDRSAIDTVRGEVRRALLDADVHPDTTRLILTTVEQDLEHAVQAESLSDSEQVVAAVRRALVAALGGDHEPVCFDDASLRTVVMAGLQGVGKTTTTAKVAARFCAAGRRPLLAACDLARPGAVAQLQTVAASIGVDVVVPEPGDRPLDVAERARVRADVDGYDVVLIDTAGRLTVDTAAMDELEEVVAVVDADVTWLVVDAMSGTSSLDTAATFNARVGIDGVIISKLDSDARGGVALSVASVVGAPVLFAGVGERPVDLETFHAEAMADRILGFGDLSGLAERARAAGGDDSDVDVASFDFDALLPQLRMVQRMGSVSSLLSLIPGLGDELDGAVFDDAAIGRLEAIVLAMTTQERARPEIIDGSRRARIAAGSGTTVADVANLVEKLFEMRDALAQKAEPSTSSARRAAQPATTRRGLLGRSQR